MKKRCELCKSTARIYCDSDTANLCWSCDTKVHSANFLVAKHSRSLLCQICQSPTPWCASGEKIGPTTASICGRCVVEDISDVSDDEFDEDREDLERVDDNDEIELDLVDSVDRKDNQVVPSPPAASSSSSSSTEEFSIGGLMNRKRKNVLDLTSDSEDEIDSSSVNINHNTTSNPILEPSIGDKTTSFNSQKLISGSTVGKLKKIRHQNVTSVNERSEPVSKSTKTAELTFNSSD